MFSYEEIKKAEERIRPYIVKTPLVRLVNLDPYLHCEVYAKLENLQLTGAFKLRGALNKILLLSRLEKKEITVQLAESGLWLPYSSGNLNSRSALAKWLEVTQATRSANPPAMVMAPKAKASPQVEQAP